MGALLPSPPSAQDGLRLDEGGHFASAELAAARLEAEVSRRGLSLLSRQGHYGEAEAAYLELHAIDRAIHGDTHRNVQQDRFQYARAIAMQMRHAAAASIFAEVLGAQRDLFEEGDRAPLLTRAWLGQELLRAGLPEEARPHLEAALEGLRAGGWTGTIEGIDLEENLSLARSAPSD